MYKQSAVAVAGSLPRPFNMLNIPKYFLKRHQNMKNLNADKRFIIIELNYVSLMHLTLIQFGKVVPLPRPLLQTYRPII